MSLLAGAGVLTVTWCLLVVWVARVASSRGRSMLLWSLIGGGVGAIGNLTGFALARQMLGGEGDVGIMVLVAALFTPLITLVLPMLAVGYIVRREPMHVPRKVSWPVSFLGKGNGTIELVAEGIRIVQGESTKIIKLEKVEADGECVRIAIGGEELVAMPMGEPATPAGRRHQSLVLAKQLRQTQSR